MSKHFWIGLAFIFAITVICYYPSFGHLLRGETYTYLLDTKGVNSAYELVTKYSFYEKVRIYDPGDRWLFKPLLFVIVGIEKSLFGVNAIYWRIASFAMHLFATFALYRLLWRLKPGVLAVSVTLFFSIMYITVNTVLYEQIASYMLFVGLTLTAIYCLADKKRLWLAVTSIAISAFIYEIGIVLAVVFILHILYWRRAFSSNWRKWAIGFSGILPVYIAIYLAEKLINPAPGLFTEYGKLATIQTIMVGLEAMPIVTWNWLIHIAMPACYLIKPFPGLRGMASQVYDNPTSMIPLNALSLVGAVVVSGMVWIKAVKVRYQFVILMGLVLLSFVGVISIFRVNTHGISYLKENGFNAYMFTAFLAVLFYALVAGKKSTVYERRAIAGFLIVPIFLSGMQVYNLNRDIYLGETVSREYFAYVDKFVNEHKNEPDFTFRSDSPLERQLTFRLFTVRWDPGERVHGNYTITEALYADYWSDNPKYVLEYP